MLLSWTLLCDPQSYLENFRLCFAVAKRGLFPFNRGGRGNFEKILRVNFPRIWKSSARDAATKFHVAWYQQMRLHEWNTMTREDTWSKRDTFFFYIYITNFYITRSKRNVSKIAYLGLRWLRLLWLCREKFEMSLKLRSWNIFQTIN